MAGIISFKEIMKRLWDGETMDLTVVKYSIARKEGGAIRHYKGVRLNVHKERETRSQVGDPREDIKIMASVFARPKPKINIILPNNELRAIYKVGIIRANNQTVAI